MTAEHAFRIVCAVFCMGASVAVSKVDRLIEITRKHGVVWAARKVAGYPAAWVRRKRFERSGLSLATSEERFNWIYRNRYWGDGETTSGSGSTASHTANLRATLPAVVQEFGIRTMLDAPCGDFAWMQMLLKDMAVDYIGGDIVRPMVEDLQKRHGGDRVRFLHIDITRDPLPSADMMLCRDCLFHLSYEDTAAALENFLASGIPYLLTTTHRNTTGFKNRNIVSGENRLMDLFSAPYDFPSEPLARFDDWIPPKAEREMCLWSREQLAESTAAFRRRYGGKGA